MRVWIKSELSYLATFLFCLIKMDLAQATHAH